MVKSLEDSLALGVEERRALEARMVNLENEMETKLGVLVQAPNQG